MGNTSSSSWSSDALAEQIARLQRFAAHDGRQAGPAQAQKTVLSFWEHIDQTTDGCWLWKSSDPKARIWWGTSSYQIEPERLAWVLGTGREFPHILRPPPR